MFRTSVFAITLLVLLSPVAFAQEAAAQPLPAGIPGPQLVAWSELQTPRPIPQPLPGPQPAPPAQPPERQPTQEQWAASQQRPGDSQALQNPAIQAYTGTVVSDREGSRCALKVADGTVYELDEQKAQRYAGQQVRVAGSLDPASYLLHVTGIEALP